MAATGKVIGTVTAVVGEAKATGADGTIRILQVGDAVHSDEVISTSAAGSINVALANGKTLDCGGDADLSLHEGLLNVATTAAPTSAPAADVDAIQRVIVAGQDPSLVAPATAAGGAPAAGGADEGGAHNAVVIEQSNSASVVSSGFSTEGDSIAFPNQVPQALPVTIVVSNSALVVPGNENTAPATSHAPVFESNSNNNVVPASAPAAEDHPIQVAAVEPSHPTVPATVVADQGSQNNAPQVVEVTPAPTVVTNEPAPQADAGSHNQPEAPVTVSAPVTVVADSTPQDQPHDTQPPVTETQPTQPTVVVVADNTPPANDPVVPTNNTDNNGDGSGQPPVVVTNNPDQPPVVAGTPDTTPPVVTDGGPSGQPDTLPGSVSLAYTITANTNQDEQLGLLTFENGQNKFQELVFFGQEGQQKPTAVSLDFALTQDTSTVKLQYIDSFAGSSDANTGHTATQIAIKQFGLTIDGVPTMLAQQNDGVNVGIGNKTLHTEGSVDVDMHTGQAGNWSFSNPTASTGVDILDFTGSTLDLGAVVNSNLQSLEVINLKGSAAQELALSVGDVLKVTDGADVLHVIGGKEDTLNLTDSGWHVVDGDTSAAGTQASYFGWVQVSHDSGATLLVDPDVQIKGAAMG